jgi:hypothetical protein
LIVLDTSLDGTSAYLASIAAAHQRVEVVRTLTDLGLAQGVDTGRMLARPGTARQRNPEAAG